MKHLALTVLLRLAVLLALAGPLCGTASAAGFSDWAVLIVAGDNHAHSGAYSAVFDNARKDLAKGFAAIGFSPKNMVQFSVDPSGDVGETSAANISNGLWDLSDRAKGGCLIYFTSHGSQDGIVSNGTILRPAAMSAIVDNSCGTRPAVIVMSACFSGQFIRALSGDNRMVFTAARPDRTSFGCGEQNQYTFFDGCFLQALPQSGDFPDLADKTTQCVGQLEHQLGVEYPSEPQLSIGKNVMFTLRWK